MTARTVCPASDRTQIVTHYVLPTPTLLEMVEAHITSHLTKREPSSVPTAMTLLTDVLADSAESKKEKCTETPPSAPGNGGSQTDTLPESVKKHNDAMDEYLRG